MTAYGLIIFDGSGCEEYPGEIRFPGMPMDGPRKQPGLK